MAVYKFRVTFEDYDDVSRDIEVKSTQTFGDLNTALHAAIGFDAKHAASFYMSDDLWKKGKEITLQAKEGSSVALMANSRLCDFIIDPHQKIYYVFDPAALWSFYIELIKIQKEEDNASYPRCVKVSGDAPKQYGAHAMGAAPSDFDFLQETMVGTSGGEDDDELLEGTEGEDDEEKGEDGEEMDEFSNEGEDHQEEF
jgi:hypothetical protein